MDTELRGHLAIVTREYKELKKVKAMPTIYYLRLRDKDKTLCDYELPLNCHFDCKLGSQLIALKIVEGQWLGFYFWDASDKDMLEERLDFIEVELSCTNHQISNLKNEQKRLEAELFQLNFSKVESNPQDFFKKSDEVSGPIKMRKLLETLGLELDVDLADNDVISVI